MPSPLDRLPAKGHRGSRLRCVPLTDGPAEQVVQRLTAPV